MRMRTDADAHRGLVHAHLQICLSTQLIAINSNAMAYVTRRLWLYLFVKYM